MCSKRNKDVKVKAFNMIRNKDEIKAMTEHISSDFKRKFNSTTYNSKQKWNKKKGQCECKSLNLKYEIDNNWNHSSCICEYNKYSKSVVDISVDECDEIVIVMNNLSTKKTNTIATNVTRD